MLKKRLVQFGIIAAAVAVIVAVYALTPRAHSNKIIQEQSTAWVVNQGAGLYGRITLKDLELDNKQHIQEGNVFRNAVVAEDNNNATLLAGGKMLQIDSVNPNEITAATLATAENTPGSSTVVKQAGNYMGLLSAGGVGYISKVDNIKASKTINQNDDKFVALSVSEDGFAIAYSENRKVVKYDFNNDKYEVLASEFGPEKANYSLDGFEVTTYGKEFALLHTPSKSDTGILYSKKNTPEVHDSPRLAEPSVFDKLYISTSNGLYDFTSGQNEVHKNEVPGYPTRPVVSPLKCGESPLVYSLWQGTSGILSLNCNNQVDYLPDSKPRSDSTGDRGLTLQITPKGAVLNATKSGEVWVASRDKFDIVRSTLNNWETELDKRKDNSQKEDPKENVCPTPPSGDNAMFGVRPGKDNRIPVLLSALDGNRSDVLTIVGEPQVSNKDMGDFRVIDNGSSLALNLSDSAGSPRSTAVTVTVTDGGSDMRGTCMVPMTFTIQEHLYSEPNETPKRLGNGVPEDHLAVAKYPATATVDALTGWVDPDGDDLLLTTTENKDGKVVANPNGKLSFQAENVDIGHSAEVGLQIFDNLGTSTRSSLIFQAQDPAPISLDSLSREGKVNQQQTIDLTNCIHGAVGFTSVQLSDIPQHLSATVDSVGLKVNLTADQPGNYRLTYAVEGSKNAGVINFVAKDDYTSRISVAPFSVFMQSYEDTSVDISSIVTGSGENPYFIKSAVASPKNFNNSPMADISADVIDYSKVRISAKLLQDDQESSDFTDVGNVALDIESINPQTGLLTSTTSRIQVFITNPTTTIAPIAVKDQIIAHRGASITVDALANDIGAFGDVLLLDPRYSTDPSDIATKGLLYVQGGKLRYVAPINTNEDKVSLDYYIYVRGHAETSRVRGEVDIKLLNSESSPPLAPNIEGKTVVGGTADIIVSTENVDADGDSVVVKSAKITSGDGAVDVVKNGSELQISSLGTTPGVIVGEYVMTDDTHDTVGHFYVLVTENQAKAVGFNDYIYAPNDPNKKVSVNPLDNDTIPSDVATKITKARLLPPAGAKSGTTVREIADENELQNFSVVAGEGGATTIWEVQVELSSKGTTAGTLTGEKLGTMTEYVIVKLSNEKPLPDYPKFSDIYVKNSEIKHRSSFEANVAGDNLVWSGDSSDFVYSSVGELNGDNTLGFSGSNVQGSIKNVKQMLAFRASLKSEGSISTFGVIHAPALSSVLPQRKNQEVKTVEVGKTDLHINVRDEIELLEDTSLSVENSVEHVHLRPQSNCNISNGEIVYSPGKMRDGLTVDTDTKDVCAVYVAWNDEPKSRTIISFQINIIPENQEPTIQENVQLQDLEPKTDGTVNLHDYLKWYGHAESDVQTLQITCSSPSSSNDIIVSCAGQQIKIEIPQKARELVDHKITLQITGHQSPAVTWNQHIRAAVKNASIEVPLHGEVVVIKEKQDSPTVNVAGDVRDWLDSYYYGYQDGASIDCDPRQDAKVNCQSFGSGTLKFTISAGSEDTGFKAIGRYIFQDRADSGGGVNRGHGTVSIDYQALPKQPPQPALNISDAQNGTVNLTVSQAAISVPETTDLCLVVIETGQNLCKNPGGGMSVSFSTNGELGNLEKWKTYTFNSYAKNSVGESPHSIDVKATPFVPLKSPTASWSLSNDKKLRLTINDIDPNTEAACGIEIKYPGSTTCANPGQQPGGIEMPLGANWNIEIQAKAKKVIAGDTEITPAPSKIITINAVSPGNAQATISDIQGDSDTMEYTVNGAFVSPSAPATKYFYYWSANGNCSDDSRWKDGQVQGEKISGNPGESLQVTICTKTEFDTAGLVNYEGNGNGQTFDQQVKIRETAPISLPNNLWEDVRFKISYSPGNSASTEAVPNTIMHHNSCSIWAFWCKKETNYNIIIDTPPSAADHHAKAHLVNANNGKSENKTYTLNPVDGSAHYQPGIVHDYTYQGTITSSLNGSRSFLFSSPSEVFGSSLNGSDARLEVKASGEGFTSSGNQVTFTGTVDESKPGKQEWSGNVSVCVYFQAELTNLVSSNAADNKQCWSYSLHYEKNIEPCQYDPTIPATDSKCKPAKTPEQTCTESGRYWYDNSCHNSPKPEESGGGGSGGGGTPTPTPGPIPGPSGGGSGGSGGSTPISAPTPNPAGGSSTSAPRPTKDGGSGGSTPAPTSLATSELLEIQLNNEAAKERGNNGK
jgi:hypothetical protein